ncbi:MAG TPA: hypothetical protein VL993_08730 [Stellaceae bacterium]|nr:hypothetical protein [Stellaceae bacterium]
MSRRYAKASVMLFALACAACGSTSDIVALTPAQIAAEPTNGLCDQAAAAIADKEAILSELLRRHAITAAHVEAVRNSTVVTGMNSCETIAAWGPPAIYSSMPGIDYPGDHTVSGAAMVYDYGRRGKIGFDAKGFVLTVVR